MQQELEFDISFSGLNMNARSDILYARFKFLEETYNWYDRIARSFRDWACRPGCSICCTSSVILTTLEAAYLWEKYSALLGNRLAKWTEQDLLPPLKMSTNEQAALCISRQDFEEEEVAATGIRCPLLEDNMCLCYEGRPLMCRMMFSSVPCKETGQAEAPSRLLSLNIACLQLAEHIDNGGWSGYLTHLLPHFVNEEVAISYFMGSNALIDPRLRPNRANPGFLIPPGDEAQVKGWLKELGSLQNGS